MRLAHEARAGKGSASKEPPAKADKAEPTTPAPGADLEKLIEAKLSGALKPFLDRYAKEDEERALTKKQQEEASKQEAEAQRARAEEEAAAAAAEKQLAKERRAFKKTAEEAGALVKDEDAFEEVQTIFERRLSRMSEEDFEEKFGGDVAPEDVKKNTLALLADIKKRSPGLFAAAETSVAGATTGKPTPSPDGKASGGGAAAAATTAGARVLDAQRLSAKQFREYLADRAGFRKRFEQGLIDYEKK